MEAAAGPGFCAPTRAFRAQRIHSICRAFAMHAAIRHMQASGPSGTPQLNSWLNPLLPRLSVLFLGSVHKLS